MSRNNALSSTETNNSNASGPKIKHHNVVRPPQLDTDATYSKFLEWRNSYNDYAMLQKINELPLDIQRADFRCCLTEQMKLHLKCAIGINEDSDLTVVEIMDQIQKYLRQKRNVALDRVAFDERKQHKGETFDEFFVDIKKLSIESDFCEQCYEQRLTTKIMSGIASQEVRQKLLAFNPFPSLQDVVDVCRSEESASKDSQALHKKAHIDHVKCPPKLQQTDRKDNKPCIRSGYKFHKNGTCPAIKSRCRYCNLIGHWDKMCLKKPKSDQASHSIPKNDHAAHKTDHKSVKAFKVADVKSKTSTPTIEILCKPKGLSKFQRINCIPDTGAEISICGENILKQLKINEDDLLHEYDEKLVAANNTEIETLGKISLKMQLNQRSTVEDIIVCKNQDSFLLSWQVCKNLGIIPQNFPKPIQKIQVECIRNVDKLKQELIEEFSDVFNIQEELPVMLGEPMQIHLQENAKPYAVHVARQIPFLVQDEMKKELDDMVARNIIRPLGDEPSQWCHPMVVVPTSKGGVRICVDLTKLNKCIDRPSYSAKTPREAVTAIDNKAKYFSTFDAKNGYWQLPLEECSQPLTTFITPYGR